MFYMTFIYSLFPTHIRQPTWATVLVSIVHEYRETYRDMRLRTHTDICIQTCKPVSLRTAVCPITGLVINELALALIVHCLLLSDKAILFLSGYDKSLSQQRTNQFINMPSLKSYQSYSCGV